MFWFLHKQQDKTKCFNYTPLTYRGFYSKPWLSHIISPGAPHFSHSYILLYQPRNNSYSSFYLHYIMMAKIKPCWFPGEQLSLIKLPPMDLPSLRILLVQMMHNSYLEWIMHIWSHMFPFTFLWIYQSAFSDWLIFLLHSLVEHANLTLIPTTPSSTSPPRLTLSVDDRSFKKRRVCVLVYLCVLLPGDRYVAFAAWLDCGFMICSAPDLVFCVVLGKDTELQRIRGGFRGIRTIEPL